MGCVLVWIEVGTFLYFSKVASKYLCEHHRKGKERDRMSKFPAGRNQAQIISFTHAF